jgi:hypothetical protein
MPQAYDLHDAHFVQESAIASAADDLSVSTPIVPPGKIWTILNASYRPSVAETKIIFYAIIGRAGLEHAVTRPTSIALLTTNFNPAVTEGMEIRLYPGEQLRAYRDSGTAGSSMYLRVRFIETDMPYFSYVEPQRKIIQKHGQRGMEVVLGGAGGGGLGGGPGGPGGGKGGSGGRGSEPI